MNLRRHLNVLLRFKLIIISGCLLGIVLGVTALFEVRTTGLTWRAQETWSSSSTLFVTQQGFPEGRVVLGAGATGPDGAPVETPAGKPGKPFADPGRFTNLAIVYSYFLQSDRIRGLIHPRPAPDQVTVVPVPAAVNSSETLPLLTLTTNAHDAGEARSLNTASIRALKSFLEREQARNEIAADNRVRVEVLNPPARASILVGRSKTPAIVAFILCLAASVALAYCLDNLYPARPRDGDVVAEDVEDRPPVLEELWPVPAARAAPDAEPTRRAS